MTSLELLDWRRLGSELRMAALECGGPMPPVADAYRLMLEYPEFFSFRRTWPDGMPADPPLELVEAYLGT